jgi:urease accessory protein
LKREDAVLGGPGGASGTEAMVDLGRPPGEAPDATARWPARLTLRATRDAREGAWEGAGEAAHEAAHEGAHAGQGGTHRGAITRLHGAHIGPLRLLKTLYPEGPGVAHAVLVHPPGGLVGGDRLDVDVAVERGAHLLVTNPAATRFYRSVAGVAAQRVMARVAAGARLEWLPQETLAYDGCDALNTWHVRLEGDASLMAMEVLALGLGAAGKPFARGRFVQQFEIEGLWRERGVIDALDSALLDGPCGLAGRRVLGTLVLASGEALAPAVAEAALEAARETLADETVPDGGQGPSPQLLAGATLLHGRLLVLRVLAHEVEPAMRRLRRVRGLWRQLGWGLEPNEPRIWAS